MLFLLLLHYWDVCSTGFLLLGVHGLFTLVELLDDCSEILQVLPDHSKLLNRQFFPVVVVVEVVGLDLLEFLLFVRLLHVNGVVIETSDVFSCVDDLARLEVANRLCSSFSVLAELLQVVNRHQDPRKLSDFA